MRHQNRDEYHQFQEYSSQIQSLVIVVHMADSPGAGSESTKSSSSIQRLNLNPNWKNTPMIVAMVGLPARGKTYISTRLSRYLNWVGIKTRLFNVGMYRRKNSYTSKMAHSADFFDPKNEDAVRLRESWRKAALNDIIQWIKTDEGSIAIYDATNVERPVRNSLYEFCSKHGFKLFFIESECNDEEIIERTVREVKLHGPDYQGVDVEQAERDFKTRIENYSKVYDPLCRKKDDKISFIKLIDVGQSYIVHRVQDHIQSRMVYFLMNIKVSKSSIYLCRHGESQMNVKGQIGGDSMLSPRGEEFGMKLGDFMKKQPPMGCVWTSELKRTQQTAGLAGLVYEPWKALNEIDGGVCEGLTYEEIKEQYPEEYQRRKDSKYSYRYPMGESYYDLVIRLEPVIMELERSENVLVVCHQAVIRCLLAYFRNEPQDDLPYIRVPLHTVIKLTQHAHACDIEEFPLGIEGADTHVPREN